MYDLVCDCPYHLGTGECDLLSDPTGKRKYPQGCPKRFSSKPFTRHPKKSFSDIL
ncbi:MAG: hypothetical protein AAGU27_00480 [Dehalobacterium sp.]